MRFTALLLLLLPLCAQADTAAPEAASGFQTRPAVYSRHSMVSTANPYASAAARDILRRGGSAIDAAIAAQLVLGLTEPQSSGIGGGAFMLYFDGRKLTSFDGRETAPATADSRLFLQADGKTMDFYRAVVGGRSVGVPGVVAMLKLAHQRGGKLPWASLFQPAITLARNGFAVSPRLHALLGKERFLQQDPQARAYFYQADGKPLPVGSLLKNPDYAATLELLARQGPAAFYQGEIASAIISAVNQHPVNPGRMLAADLAAYQAIERQPLCGPYRSWQVCGMDAPSSGGVAVLQMLGMLQRFPLASMSPTGSDTIHLFAEANKLAFADRNRYLADPDFVAVPSQALVSRDYLQQRSLLIAPDRSMGRATAGEPAGVRLSRYGRDSAPELPSTSHLNIVDRAGRVVSMTSSIEDQFGSRLMVKGFLLNNQLTDFSFRPDEDGRPVANRVEARKRPRSSMSPTVVFDARGQFLLATGSPGGSQIIGYVSQTLLGLLDWKLDPQQAVSLPHYGNRNGVTELESGRGLTPARARLGALGHRVEETEMTSGLSAIVRTTNGYVGGADPRREGVVLGD
ncbi:gamma-glutamyltranspeptidase [Aquitalea magnusonii]|uniref:Glutathione hydrolase proenzyme n=1 Tax=Aquitalea magnusonii TaxID=332411 RepID=A0A3G9GM67_9NEIS|nr:gamma-glutamyltransferase [Aquitalea magnusonii]BBF87803.1 gamma-glutamyltranspeptidase [Aquitalea magnusonii]